MRVIAGTARSLPLKTPKGMDTRPTIDRIKETLFNIIQSYIPGSVFVDLFSGSGAIGIEALSRGASHSYFVENEKEAIACITSNVKFTHFEDKATIISQDVFGALYSIHEKNVDVIFMDPPYGKELEKRALSLLVNMPYVTEDTLIIVESQIDEDFSYAESFGFEVTREKCYKTNKHVFLKKVQLFTIK